MDTALSEGPYCKASPDQTALRAENATCRVNGQKMDKPARKQVADDLEHDPEKWMPVFRKDHAQTLRPPIKKTEH